ncbi:MAG: serine hydrolase [Bacteroidales bacterium]|nr:MAG: serine hydrolase [Bacteroidales bacterium]
MRNKRHAWTISLIVSMLLIGIRCFAQTSDDYLLKIRQFEEFVMKMMELDRIPGLAAGFYIDDFEWTKGFGYADLEQNVPATENSSFRLASNTKSMTAVAILQLAEKGKIDLDADVRTYVPYFPPKRWQFTTRQLLGHLAGISHYRDYETEGHIKTDKDTRESLDIFDDFELIAEPGTRYSYSSYGYNLLGAIVESASGQPFGHYLTDHIWTPLNMFDTYMDSPTQIIPNRVAGYRLNFGNLENSEFVNMSSRFAAGGTRSTVKDLLKYARGFETTKILTEESIDMLETSMHTKGGYFTGYGMGWQVTPVNGHFIAMHTGSQQETRTILIRLPQEHAAIAMAYNFEGGNLRSYVFRLYQLLFGEHWNIPVYTETKENDAIYLAIRNVFNHGLGYFDRNRTQSCHTTDILASAFGYFNTAVHTDSLVNAYENSRNRIEDGRHPVANQAFIDIGSYMAQTLLKNSVIKNYHREGAIGFFNDYIDAYKTHPDIPAEFRFDPVFENIILRWNEDWEKVWNDDIRSFKLTAWSDPSGSLKKLKNRFSGSAVYPYFMDDISGACNYLILTGENKEALETAELAQQLYPRSASSLVLQANAYLMMDNRSRAAEILRQAMQIKDPTDRFNAGTLTSIAGNLMIQGNLDKAIELLIIAGDLYPEEARIPELTGEIYLEKSRRNFRKSLELDPSREGPWNMLHKIK